MIGFIIVILTAIGEILGQFPVPGTIEVLTAFPLDPGLRVTQDGLYLFQVLQPNSMLLATPTMELHDSDLFHPSTLGEHQTKGPESKTPKVRPNPRKIELNMAYSSNNVNGEIRTVGPSVRNMSTTSRKSSAKLQATTTKAEQTSQKSSSNSTTEKVPQTVIKVNGIDVTFDGRASFDGDKCPTGYVRVNGMCVERD